jgi:hypothetical protein
MPQYLSTRKTYNLYRPGMVEPFKLSRTKLDLSLECPRCFYLDRRFGIARPSGPAFTLNSAVDALLKKEFDIHRAKDQAHPLMQNYKLDVKPFKHKLLEEWRNNFRGVQVLHQPTNFLVYGAVDDIWVEPGGEIMVVEYKSTSTDKEIDLNDQYKQAFKRQVEIYQWLLRHSSELKKKVSDIAFFVYCNGRKDKEAFDAKLEFNIELIAYKGNNGWVEGAILQAHKVLNSKKLPPANPTCEYCQYREMARAEEKK